MTANDNTPQWRPTQFPAAGSLQMNGQGRMAFVYPMPKDSARAGYHGWVVYARQGGGHTAMHRGIETSMERAKGIARLTLEKAASQAV